MLDVSVELDAIAGGENDALPPLSVVGELFERFFERGRGEVKSLT
jgi:hypothetical protein